MTRILLFTGKGGVGKTSIAAAHAVASARQGRDTILISLDLAHNLSDQFGVPPCPEPTRIRPHLDLLEIDPNRVQEEEYPELMQSLATMVTDVEQTEDGLQNVPGFDNLFFLLKVLDLAQAGRHERIILDCAPTGETIALLELPEQIGWYMERFFGFEKLAVRALRPMSKQLFKVQMPTPQAMNEFERLFGRLLDTQALLKDPATTSVRLVTMPEKMVVAETRRSYLYLNLFGYTVDGLIVNNVYPAAEVGDFFAEWVRLQEHWLAELKESFGHLPTTRVRRYATDLQGTDAIERLADDCVGPDAFTPAPDLANETYAKTGDGYRLTLRTPGADRGDIDLFHAGNELTLKIGTFKRKVMLPDVLRRHEVAAAKRSGDELVITFQPTQEPATKERP